MVSLFPKRKLVFDAERTDNSGSGVQKTTAPHVDEKYQTFT